MPSIPTVFAQLESDLGVRVRAQLDAFPRVSGGPRDLHLEGCALFDSSSSRTLTEHLLTEHRAGFSASCDCTSDQAHSQTTGTLHQAQLLGYPASSGTQSGRRVSEARQLRDRLVGRPGSNRGGPLVHRLKGELGDEAEPLVVRLVEILDARIDALKRELEAWRHSHQAREMMELRALARTQAHFRDDEDLNHLLDAHGPHGLLTPEELTTRGSELPAGSRAHLEELLAANTTRATTVGQTLVRVHPHVYTPTGGFDAFSTNVLYADALVRYQKDPNLWVLPTSLAPLVRWPRYPALASFDVIDLEASDAAVLDTLVTLVKDAHAAAQDADLPELLDQARALG